MDDGKATNNPQSEHDKTILEGHRLSSCPMKCQEGYLPGPLAPKPLPGAGARGRKPGAGARNAFGVYFGADSFAYTVIGLPRRREPAGQLASNSLQIDHRNSSESILAASSYIFTYTALLHPCLRTAFVFKEQCLPSCRTRQA